MQTGPNYATSELDERALRNSLDAVIPASVGWRRWRLLVSAWTRFTRWEYWPIWAIYPPVVLTCLWLAVRHRGAMLFTAVNPGMPAAGGVVGFSKAAILRGLAGAGEAVATWAVIEPGAFPARNAAVRRFMAENDLRYPIVLKPDRGERGSGVVIARDAVAVEAALRGESGPLIAQAYVPGMEWGVFYVRHPADAQGRIFAVTDKRMVHVTGDGRRTLERLILQDRRAIGMARFFLEKFSARLAEIPAEGEQIALSELGTHCRGALFLDGEDQITPELTAAVDRVSRAYEGFYFGRYDLRAESVEAMRAGRFQVIELNGVTSEATSMYDPRHSVWFGWRTLCRQWRLAFEIGAANRRSGARVWTLGELRQLLREHREA